MKGGLRGLRWGLYLILSCLCLPASAERTDPLAGQPSVSASQVKDVMTGQAADLCQFNASPSSLALLEAIERALCRDPEARQAWADVKLRAAQLGTAEAAYMPTLNFSVGISRANSRTVVRDLPELNYHVQSTTRNVALNLSWTLFDFGLRKATLNSARQVVFAANATQDSVLQNVFASTAELYYQLMSAQGALEARKQAERAARESFLSADARHTAGAGTLSDKLQAQTNYAQASLDRVKAEGEWKTARGTLAIVIGLPADSDLTLDSDNTVLPGPLFQQSVRELMREAEQGHPNLVAARAQLRAAEENVAAARAEGKPNVVLAANLNRTPQVGVYPSELYTQNKGIGLQLSMPLLDGRAHASRVSAARAQEEEKAAELSKSEQQVALDVWKSFQNLETEAADVQATSEFVQAATQSYQVAQGRYKGGVGTIIELMSAQSALSSATQQQVQALAAWRIARLKLALSLGKLGFWTLK